MNGTKKILGYFLLLSFTVVIFHGPTTKGFCKQSFTHDTLEVREEGENYKVTFEIKGGVMILYFNGEDCGNPNHRTIGKSRYFEHFHITYTLPQEGVDDKGDKKTVTIENTTEWWKYNYYSEPYVQIQNADPQYNCWGYSLGYYVWIQDPSYIYEDDYNITPDFNSGNKETDDGHIIDITHVGASSPGIKQTNEKNRNSPVYSRYYDIPRKVESGYEMRVRK